MARLHQTGFELNSLTGSVEFNTIGSAGNTITGGAARSGSFGLRISSLTSATAAGVQFKWSNSSTNTLFFRAYLNIQTLPSASNHIMSLNNGTSAPGNTPRCKITLESNGTLILRNQSGTQIGSASATLGTGTWYMLELKSDAAPASGSRVIEAKLDGVVFATSSTQTQLGAFAYSVGGNMDGEAQTTGEWWFDDVAVNDNTGSFQTGYPGQGKIIFLRPNAAGDVNTFDTQIGGTAGAANNFTRVNEVTPNDLTTYNGTLTVNNEDLFNVDDTDSGFLTTDIVSVVMVGVRFRVSVNDATSGFRIEIEKASGGTITQSATIVPATTTWFSNAIAVPRNYPLIMYQDPDAGTWNKNTLNSMQIGYKMTAAATGTGQVNVSTIYASVEYTSGSSLQNMMLMGVG